MEKKLFRSLILLITYAVVLVAVIVKLDAVGGWLGGVLAAFQPLIAGLVIAFILDRPCNFFARQYAKLLPGRAGRAARPLAVVTAYLAVILFIAVLVALVVPELTHSIEMFIGNIGTYAANFQDLYDWVVAKLDLEQLASLDLSSGISDTLKDLLTGALDTLTNTLPHLVTMTSVVVSGVVTGVLALVFSIYMLSGAPRLTAQCRRLVKAYLPPRLSTPLLSVAHLTVDTFSKYVNGQLVEACILGGLCFAGMCVFRFDYAPLISVIIGVSALIPIAGAYLGAGVAVLLLVMIRPLEALWFLVFLVTLQQLEGNLIYPRVVGTTMGLPGIWVLAAVTVGGSLLGLAGMVVSVPIAAVLYTLLKNDLRARLSAQGTPPAPEEPGPEA
ncbi:MAG: AI-2E family transporter [Oscillospiraceae bacterium]|jgi:predicted PurR-regulated permease PerM|nr:AI-2E family transporter [Oscillospiraceae bacterium]MCI9289793.1 AI-2E family transporter [Oscillospiraceae bacterium]MCI9551311.1 AI-2E family transporter [Oscillospiraceae bacterium]